MKIIIPVYEKNHVVRIQKLIEKLKNNQILILGLNSETREVFKENGIECKSPLDYLTKEQYREIYNNGRNLIRKIPELNKTLRKMTTYKNLPLLEMDESRIYRGHYIERIIEYIELLKKVIEIEKPDMFIVLDDLTYVGKTIMAVSSNSRIPYRLSNPDFKTNIKYFTDKKITPHLIKNFRRFRDIQRKITSKKMIKSGKKKKKILTITYDLNQVKALKPIIDKLEEKSKYDFIIIRSDSVLTDRTKKILDSMGIPYNTFESYIDWNVIENVRKYDKFVKKEWKKLKNSKEFAKSLKYKDVPIYLIFRDIFDLLFSSLSHLADLVKQIEIIRNIIEVEKPNLVIILGEVSSLRRILVRMCKEKKIPTLFLQHGVFGPDTIFDMIISDKMAVQGNFTKKILLKLGVKSKDISVIGQPRYDIFYHMKFDKQKTFEKFDLDQNKKLILVTTQPMRFWGGEGKEAFIRGVVNAMKDLPQYQFLIKLHPFEEREIPFYKKIVDEYSTKAKVIYHADTNELINACDLMISGFSTTVLEAIIMDKPVAIINLTHKKDMMPYAESGAAVGIYNANDIKSKILDILNNESTQKTLKMNRKKFIKEHLYKIDGKSTDRAISLIEKMIS